MGGGWSSDHLVMDMDNASPQCGFGTSPGIDITPGWLRVLGQASAPSSDSWSGTFKAPDFGYAGSSESKKFQIKVGGSAGCARYIYEWSE